MTQTIAILNPNSSRSVTDGIAAAIRDALPEVADRFIFLALHEGPPGIVTQEDADLAAELVQAWADERHAEFSALGIACFSDPGVQRAREKATVPVLGLGEAALRAALARGQRVGVVAVADSAIPRHLRHWESLGLRQHVVAERAINLSVAESGDPTLAYPRILATARALIEEDGADVILLGCAGMAPLCPALRAALPVPLVEPCTALAEAALAATGAVAVA